MGNRKFAQHIKIAKYKNIICFGIQITKKDLRTYNLGLYSKHQKIQTPFTHELVPN
jgi:hypothetical protein